MRTKEEILAHIDAQRSVVSSPKGNWKDYDYLLELNTELIDLLKTTGEWAVVREPIKLKVIK